MALGPLLARLRGYLATSGDLLELVDEGPLTNEQRDTLRQQLRLITRAAERVEFQNDRWAAYIVTLADQAPEELVYNGFGHEGVHFMAMLDRARETIDLIEIAVGEGREEASSRSEHSIHREPPPRPPRFDEDDNSVRLPVLKLPSFGGNPIEWPAFWQSFESAVHDQRMAEVQKMNYLVPCLKDAAKKAVDGYVVTNEN